MIRTIMRSNAVPPITGAKNCSVFIVSNISKNIASSFSDKEQKQKSVELILSESIIFSMIRVYE
jgi:hypothetical protein